jgi:ketosteroid isomerase-like protein
MNRTILYALLFLSCAYLHGGDLVTDVAQADKSYRHAMNARDVVVLERLVTEDFLFIRRMGDMWDKKAFLDNIQAGKLASNIQEEDLKTRIYNDTAILTHKDSLKTSDGSMVEMIATRVFVKQRGSWKLASVQDTALPTR